MDLEPVEFTLKSQLAGIDWFFIILFIVFSISIGIYFSKRGRKSVGDYFASGQGVPWWILGTSMVATTFAADTPLAISGLVVKQGIWGNWYWWAQIPMFMIGVFFFSRLWRRAKILTADSLDSKFTINALDQGSTPLSDALKKQNLLNLLPTLQGLGVDGRKILEEIIRSYELPKDFLEIAQAAGTAPGPSAADIASIEGGVEVQKTEAQALAEALRPGTGLER